MVVLGEGAVSYERDTPVCVPCSLDNEKKQHTFLGALGRGEPRLACMFRTTQYTTGVQEYSSVPST